MKTYHIKDISKTGNNLDEPNIEQLGIQILWLFYQQLTTFLFLETSKNRNKQKLWGNLSLILKF